MGSNKASGLEALGIDLKEIAERVTQKVKTRSPEERADAERPKASAKNFFPMEIMRVELVGDNQVHLDLAANAEDLPDAEINLADVSINRQELRELQVIGDSHFTHNGNRRTFHVRGSLQSAGYAARSFEAGRPLVEGKLNWDNHTRPFAASKKLP